MCQGLEAYPAAAATAAAAAAAAHGSPIRPRSRRHRRRRRVQKERVCRRPLPHPTVLPTAEPGWKQASNRIWHIKVWLQIPWGGEQEGREEQREQVKHKTGGRASGEGGKGGRKKRLWFHCVNINIKDYITQPVCFYFPILKTRLIKLPRVPWSLKSSYRQKCCNQSRMLAGEILMNKYLTIKVVIFKWVHSKTGRCRSHEAEPCDRTQTWAQLPHLCAAVNVWTDDATASKCFSALITKGWLLKDVRARSASWAALWPD